ncbi:glutamate N-acetyltransferase [Dorcoceras hygrometricum]|uniref:Glutamate N-acetyltransferase n=1 Tax=Dorcoceras hygrometricum TaxID=472368 RepID=A0A2Z7BVU6_9LAMI|nr:glutamate N-acetyltransferase [Dorcoceras hygrometricum]
MPDDDIRRPRSFSRRGGVGSSADEIWLHQLAPSVGNVEEYKTPPKKTRAQGTEETSNTKFSGSKKRDIAKLRLKARARETILLSGPCMYIITQTEPSSDIVARLSTRSTEFFQQAGQLESSVDLLGSLLARGVYYPHLGTYCPYSGGLLSRLGNLSYQPARGSYLVGLGNPSPAEPVTSKTQDFEFRGLPSARTLVGDEEVQKKTVAY